MSPGETALSSQRRGSRALEYDVSTASAVTTRCSCGLMAVQPLVAVVLTIGVSR